MNELDLLTDTGRALDPPAGPPDQLRRRVLSTLDTGEAPMVRLLRRHRRFGWAAGLAAAVLVAGSVVLFAARLADPSVDRAAPTAPSSKDPSSAAPIRTLPAADARQVLQAAAIASRSGPTPRPDQFLHVTSISVRGLRAIDREVWKSVDGTRASYSSNAPTAYIVGCKDGVEIGPGDEPGRVIGSGPCTPQPGYRTDLPTTLAGMRQQLRAKGLLDLMMDVFMQPTPNLLPAQTEAVLFEALAELPEVSLVKPVGDAAGRPSVAVSWNHSGSTLRLLFDPVTHAYRSIQIIEPGNSAPTLEDTIVRYEIVDAIPSPPPQPSAPASRPPR